MKPRLFHPEIFQGSLKKKNYFEGWYFKHVSASLDQVWSFIPGISLNRDDPHSFIQVINGISGETEYITYPLEDFEWKRDQLYLRIGGSTFMEDHIELDIHSERFRIKGRIGYENLTKYPKTLLAPGIMGWYTYVPYMECRHGIVSVNHDLKGLLTINGETTDFGNGKGYIEKDWGTSFPEVWIWIQSNNFTDPTASFSFSVAKIPWLGRFFMGFISFLHLDGRFYLFSTYNNSVISNISHDSHQLSLTLKNSDSLLEISVIKNRFGELMAPVSGVMKRRIKESIDSTVELRLYDKSGKLIYSDMGKRAGFEVIEEIFRYL
jgi:tocopherol cyclase